MFKIDKSVGYWYDGDTTILDDYAYQLYVNHVNEIYDSYSAGSQIGLINMYNGRVPVKIGEFEIVEKYYKRAEKLIRKDKIENICSNLVIK